MRNIWEMTTVDEVIKAFESAKTSFKLESKSYFDLRKSINDPFNPSDKEAAKLYKGSKRYKEACRVFYGTRDACKARMNYLLKKDIGPTQLDLENEITLQTQHEAWKDTDWFKKMKAKLEKQENEKKEGE